MADENEISQIRQDATRALELATATARNLDTLSGAVDKLNTNVSTKFDAVHGKIETAQASLSREIRNAEKAAQPDLNRMASWAAIILTLVFYFGGRETARNESDHSELRRQAETAKIELQRQTEENRGEMVKLMNLLKTDQQNDFIKLNTRIEKAENTLNDSLMDEVYRYRDGVQYGQRNRSTKKSK